MAPPAQIIGRVATIVSLQQLESDSDIAGKGTPTPMPPPAPQVLIHACGGHTLPMYQFSSSTAPAMQVRRCESEDSLAVVPDIEHVESDSGDCESPLAGLPFHLSPHGPDFTSPMMVPTACKGQELGVLTQHSLLDTVLLALWEDCADNGLFRYDVTACPTKVVPGMFGFIAQLNEGRATKKRPTELVADKVVQPFDPAKFNFTKAGLREALFQFEASADGGPHVSDAVAVNAAGGGPNLVLINVSPIEYGHVLLVPRVLACTPQLLVDYGHTLLALQFAREGRNPHLRVGYNSLGAFATINHLHFQAYYLAAPFPCERAQTGPIMGLKRKRGSAQVSRLLNYPVRGFVAECGDGDGGLEDLAALVARACSVMSAHNIPHNLFITDCGHRVFIWPQCYAERQAAGVVPEELLDTGVNPAAFEIAGHMVLKRQQDYDAISQDLVWRLLEHVSLEEERFLEVAAMCFG